MKKNLLFLASAVVALMMSSCVKDTTNDVTPGSGATHTITASIESMTRTSMNDMEVGETSQIVWSSGDKIGLVKEDGSIVSATVNAASVGKAVGEFTVSDTNAASANYIYAFYPYQSGVKYADGKLTGVCLENKRRFIPNETKGDATLPDNGLTFATNQLPMVAKADNGNLVFKSTCGIIELQLKASTPQNFYNITIHSDSKELSAYGTVDLTADEPTFVPYHMAKYSYNDITGKKYGTHSAYMMGADNYGSQDYTEKDGEKKYNGKGIRLHSEPTSLFFVVPIGTYDDLQIQVACPGLCVTKKSSKSHTVKRNTILAFKAFDVCAVDNNYGGDDVVDLSANGCANTYLVPTSASPKKYKFKPLLLGNTKNFQLADGTLIDPDGDGKVHTNQNYNTTYVYAEDSEGVITDLRRDSEYVYFTASKPGNAIIMIGSTSLERVNQFHIWVSNAKDQTLPGGHVFLNCNLGATYVPETLAQAESMSKEQLWRSAGCLYQWGNPTPRPSRTEKFIPDNFTDYASVGNANWANYGWIIHPWSIDAYSLRRFSSTANAADLIRSRMYYNFYSVVTDTYADDKTLVWWQKDRTTWGDLRFGAKALWQETKTQFDPCPPGYRVPSKQEIADAFTNNGTHTSKAYKIAKGAAGQYYTYNDQFVFVPWQGFRKPTDVDYFNYAWGNYPRTGWWFFDPSLTDEDQMVTEYTSSNIYVYTPSGKLDDNNKPIIDQNNTNVQFAKHAVYPAVELRIGGNNWWKNNANTNNNVGAPATNAFRYPVNLGMGVRCIRESNTAQQSSAAPSYNVDAATGF